MQKGYAYINDFFYFVLKPDQTGGKSRYVYCSGVDLSRFLPITKGRHRPMSNPAMRGLQLVNLGVRALALAQGATPRQLRGDFCSGIVPQKDGWYKELLLIENAPDSFPSDVINYCVTELLKKIDRACMLGAHLPDRLLQPDELQLFLEDMCRIYGHS